MALNSPYLPRSDAGLVSFSTNFNTKISADPAAYGLDIAQAAAYTVLHDSFIASYNLLQDPNTTTTPNVVGKNLAKRALVEGAGGIRKLVDIIQAFPGMTDLLRAGLAITIRDTDPTPVPIPASQPTFEILSSVGQQVNYRLRDPADPEKLGKPNGVAGAAMFAFLGDTPPLNLNEWQALASVTRTKGTLTFSSNLFPPGSKVWLTAAWFNPRNQNGPVAAAVSVYLAGGLSQAA